jgi:hypothetical protein
MSIRDNVDRPRAGGDRTVVDPSHGIDTVRIYVDSSIISGQICSSEIIRLRISPGSRPATAPTPHVHQRLAARLVDGRTLQRQLLA